MEWGVLVQKSVDFDQRRATQQREQRQRPAKNAQKDKDARWTKKNDESFYGYKNHIGVDKAHKLIRKWDATDAAVHDSQKLDDVLDPSNTGKEVWADSAYRSVADRGAPAGEGLAEPYPPACRSQSSAVRAPGVGEHDALEGARPCRACIRPPAELDGRQDRAHHRHRAGEVQDRDDEPRLQHPPAGSARADGGCARLSALTGGVRVTSCKGSRIAVRHQSCSRSGTHPGTSCGNRSLS